MKRADQSVPIGSRRAALLIGAAVLGLTACPPARAQTARGTVDEVVVTAQKREERLQDVPISVSVIQPEVLEAFQLNSMTDIERLAPSVTLTNAAGPRSFGFFVRGIGTSSFSSESIEGSTAYVLDGVVLGQSGGSLTDLADVQRIEVLRGPQGTLFGKNASAGVISVTTKDPQREFGGKVSGSIAWPGDDLRLSGVVTGPIGEDLAFSLSGRINKHDGYVENLFDGRKLNDRDDWGVRGKLLYKPSERFKAMFIADYWKRDAHCCIWTFYRVGPNPSLVPERQSIAAGIVPGPNNLTQNINGPVFSNSESFGYSLQTDFDLGDDYTLTTISAYRRFITHDGLDSDSTPANLLDVNFADFKQRQVSQEIRLTSPTGGFIDYVAGVYYFAQDVRSTSFQLFPSLPLPFFNRKVDNDASTDNYAVFGQANLNVSDDFRLILGGRFIHEKTRAQKDRRDVLLNLFQTASADKEDDAVVWRVGAQYDFSDDIMAFATVSRGYKGGGYDTNIGIGTLPEVFPEKPTSYEAGLRTSWPDQRLVLNATVFHTDVKGYQASARDPGPPPITRIFNGEAQTEGVEIEGFWRPAADLDWTISGGLAYVDAEWGDFANGPCFPGQTVAEGCVGLQQDLTHKPLPYTPKWTGNVATHYVTPFVNGLDLSLDLGVSFRSGTIYAFPNNPALFQDGYALVNAAVAIGPQDKRWKASVFVKNLTDKRYSLVYFNTPFGTAPGNYSQFIPYDAQRLVGVSVDVDF